MMETLAAAANLDDRAIVVNLLVILSVAGLVAIVMQRMRLAVVPAYLIAGAVIGPHALGFVPAQGLASVLHLAIILLLFGIGLELDVSVLKRGLGRMVMAGLGSCGICVLAGWPVARAFGLSAPAALVVSMAMALSSTAVVLRIIAARRELRRRRGRLAFAILVIQDVVVLAMLALLPALAAWSGERAGTFTEPQAAESTWTFVFEALTRVGGVAALVVLAKVLLPGILRESLRGRRLEVMMLVGISMALAAAVAAQTIGFSLEMGAFLAGFALAGTPFRHQLSGQIGPLRDIFSALFFTAVGMKLDPAILIEEWWIILLGLSLVVVLKAVVIGGVCWTLGTLASTAIAVGLSLAQAGEFSLILMAEAEELGLIADRVAAGAIAIVVLSLIVTPALAELGRVLARATVKVGHAPWVKSALLADTPDEEGPEERPLRHIILGGFGPIGHRIADHLDRAGVSSTLVELNPDTVVEQLRQQRSIVFGDVGNLAVLESAGIGHADALILTIPDEDAVMRACAVARRRAPDIFILARTGLVSKSALTARVGADQVVVDEMATAEAMLRVVAERLRAAEPEVEGSGVGGQGKKKSERPTTDNQQPTTAEPPGPGHESGLGDQ